MALTQDESFLLQEVFTKVQYDNINERYIIRLIDYMGLDLTEEQLSLLKKMCKENNIELEILPKRITNKETVILFKEYESLKSKIASSTSQKEQEKIKERLYEVRNQIANGYLEYVYKLILRQIPEIKTLKNSEDIFQVGYEELIKAIERFRLDSNVTFIQYLSKYLFFQVLLHVDLVGYNLIPNQKIEMINKSRNDYYEQYGKMPSNSKLSELTGISEREVERLLILEQFQTPQSLEMIGIEELENDHNQTYLESEELESILNDTLNREQLFKIINLLPEKYKEILMLSYGFKDNKRYTFNEIAETYHVTLEDIRLIKDKALGILQHPIMYERIKKLLGGIDEYSNPKIYKKNKNIYMTLEKKLIDEIPDSIFFEHFEKLKEEEKIFLTHYLKRFTGEERNMQDVSKIMGINDTRAYHLRKDAFNRIKASILRKHYNKSLTKKEIESIGDKVYLDILMDYYLYKGKHNQQKR